MSHPKIFLLTARTNRSLGPITVTCAITGNWIAGYGIQREFSGKEELETALGAVGLSKHVIDAQLHRMSSDWPTFVEASIEVAEKLKLIRRRNLIPHPSGLKKAAK